MGHLPVAIAAAATAVAARGIALPLLAARVSARPLDGLLDGDGELRALLARALETLPEASRGRFALLGALNAASFGLDPVAAIPTETRQEQTTEAVPALHSARMAVVIRDALAALDVAGIGGDTADRTRAADEERLAAVADDLGHLVRHSLLDATALPVAAPRFGGERVPLGGQTRYAVHPLLMAYAVERLEQLDPAVAAIARRGVREFALAFVERHQNEPRVLERERDLLLAVLTQAWNEADYSVVVRLVAGLWHLVSRVGSAALTARTLAWGISASQHLNDQYHLARFLGRLGSLRYYHGETDQARQAWEASLEIAEQLRGPSELWHPLANLAMLACAEGDFTHAQRYAEAYLRRAERDGGIPAVAGALFKRGLCAHLEGDLDQAYADLNACTRLLALRGAGDKVAHDGIFEMAAQAELARVQGDFARAQHHMEIAVTLAEEVCDHYVVADLLLDQARFARLQERQDEARVLARRVVEVATRVEAHHLRLEGLNLLRQLPEAAQLLPS
jgi:tetratricopeptide (TPR) repeat protein